MLIKKRTIKIIVGVIVAIAVIVGAVFAFQTISTNIKIKDTENKLSQINAEELETKIIKELENTDLNVNSPTSKTEFRKLDSNKSKFDSYIKMYYELSQKYFGTEMKTNEEVMTEYISAFITNSKEHGVAIPCFKIESDNNGKFKNINYLESGPGDRIETIVKNAVEKVFKNEYGIEIFVNGNDKYNLHFRNAGNILEPMVEDEEYWADVNYEITNDKSSYIPSLSTITFGLSK